MRRKLLCAAGLLAALVWVTNARGDLTQFRGYSGLGDRGPANGAPSLDGKAYGFTADNAALGNYTLTCAGSDMWGNTDSGCFAYDPAPVAGDFTAIVRLVSVNDAATTWGRTGLQARVDVDAANSPNVYVYNMSGGPGAVVPAPSEAIQTRIHQRVGLTGTGGDNGYSTSPLQVIAPSPGGPLVPIWLAMHRVGGIYIGQSADDVAGNPGTWSAPQIMSGSVFNQGPVYVGLGHQAHEQDRGARNNSATFESFGIIPFDPGITLGGVVPPLPGLTTPPPPLPAPLPYQAGSWSMREVRGLGGTGFVENAYNNLAGGGGTKFDAYVPYVNHNDPDTNGAGSGVITPDAPFLSNAAGDDNDIQVLAKGLLQAQASGRYTISARSDDGFSLRIWDVTGGGRVPVSWAGYNGSGGITPDPYTLSFPNPTGDSNTRGTIDLAVGRTYEAEYVAYENGGGAWWELASQYGDNPENARYLLIGDASHLPAQVVSNPLLLNGVADVINVPGDAGPAPGAIVTARARVAAGIADPAGTGSSIGTADSINLYDPQTGPCCGRPPVGLRPWPNNTGGDENTFTSGAFGSFTVSDDGDGTPGELKTFAITLWGDDGLQLRIIGADFYDTINGACASTLEDLGGDMALTGDCYTGDNRATGHVNLIEGQTYSFEAYQYEGGGDSGLGIFYREGRTGSADVRDFVLNNAATAFPENFGLALVPEPSTYVLAALGLISAMLIRRRRK